MKQIKIETVSHEEATDILVSVHKDAAWYTSIPGKMCHQFRGVPGSTTRGWDYLVSKQIGLRFSPHHALDLSLTEIEGYTIERYKAVFSLVIVEGGPKNSKISSPLLASYYKSRGLATSPLEDFLEEKPRFLQLIGTIKMPNLPQK